MLTGLFGYNRIMMKKSLTLLVIVVLTICLVGLAVERIVPASMVQAAGESDPALRSAGPAEKEAVPVTRAQPVVFVVIGLVCVVFGIIAVSPLLVDDPEG